MTRLQSPVNQQLGVQNQSSSSAAHEMAEQTDRTVSLNDTPAVNVDQESTRSEEMSSGRRLSPQAPDCPSHALPADNDTVSFDERPASPSLSDISVSSSGSSNSASSFEPPSDTESQYSSSERNETNETRQNKPKQNQPNATVAQTAPDHSEPISLTALPAEQPATILHNNDDWREIARVSAIQDHPRMMCDFEHPFRSNIGFITYPTAAPSSGGPFVPMMNKSFPPGRAPVAQMTTITPSGVDSSTSRPSAMAPDVA